MAFLDSTKQCWLSNDLMTDDYMTTALTYLPEQFPQLIICRLHSSRSALANLRLCPANTVFTDYLGIWLYG